VASGNNNGHLGIAARHESRTNKMGIMVMIKGYECYEPRSIFIDQRRVCR